MSSKNALRGLLAYGLVLVLGAFALERFYSIDTRSPRGPFVVTAWRNGERTGRVVVRSNPEAALQSERAIPDTTIVVDHIVDEAPAVALGRASFALSFRPGRDGVHVSFRGRDVYLTRDDLVHDRLFRDLRVGALDFGRRLDPGSVLARLARELRTSREELWREGRFRRFASITRASAGDAPLEHRDEASLTPSGLATSLKRIALFLSARVDGEGNVLIGDLVPPGTRYDWALHARVVVTLAEAARVLDDVKLRVAARRALRRLHDATTRCGGHQCVGEGAVIDTLASVEALDAFAKMGGPVRVQAFVEATRPLAEFVRSQQRPGGDFAPSYDVRAQKPVNRTDERTTRLTGRAAQALAFAYGFTQDEADLVAAQRAVAFLVRAQRLLPGRRPISAWSSICTAVGEGSRLGAPSPAGVERCEDWALATGRLQATKDTGELQGGLSSSPYEPAETVPTAEFALGVIGTLEAELGRSRDDMKIRALAVEAVKALAFLDRQSTPGERAYLGPTSDREWGPVADGPLTSHASFESTERTAAAMTEYLSLMTKRDPQRRKFDRRVKAPPPVH